MKYSMLSSLEISNKEIVKVYQSNAFEARVNVITVLLYCPLKLGRGEIP